MDTKPQPLSALTPNEEVFSLSDLGSTAALVTAGFQLKSLERNALGKVRFLFSETPEIQNALECYWANHLPVDARQLFENIKMLKSRIYGS